MTIEQAKSELMQIYGALSSNKQIAIDTLVKVSVKPQESRKGHWAIKQNVFTGGGDPVLYCPYCKSKESEHMGGIEFPQNWNWCPVCGADMREVEE